MKVLNISTQHEPDPDGDASYLEQPGFEDRLAAYNRDEFSYIGVYAEAELEVGGVIQEIRSGGLWGIEDDSGEQHLTQIEGEQLEELRSILAEMGVPAEQFDAEIPVA